MALSKGKGVSKGVVAGIVLAMLVVTVAVGVGVYLWTKSLYDKDDKTTVFYNL